MNKIFIAAAFSLLLTAFASNATAQTIDCAQLNVSTMSSDDVTRAKALCQSLQPAQEAKDITPDKVKEWASLGQEFSTAVASTAKGLGETANQFVFTPVGIMIAFYFLWGKIGGILIGIPLLIATWVLYGVICRRISTDTITYTQVPILWGALSVKKVASISYNTDDTKYAWVWIALANLLINTAILAWLIF